MEFLLLLLLFSPTGVANAIPPLLPRIPFIKNLDAPLDFGKSIKGIRIFGDHKTIRGFLIGSIFSGLLSYLFFSVPFIREELFTFFGREFTSFGTFLYGFFLGMFSLGGDSMESFFKRRLKIKPGKPWFPFDQTDYIFGGMLYLVIISDLVLYQYIFILSFYFLLHLVCNIIGYLVGLRENWI